MTDAAETAPATQDELIAQLSDVAGRDLSVDDLKDIVAEKTQRGVDLSFLGQHQARRIARLVRPRVQKPNAALSEGSREAQAKNLLVEGDNLQALVSLYRWPGHVDVD